MGAEPSALVPQRPRAKSGTNHSPGAILPTFPPTARGTAPCALRGTRTPTNPRQLRASLASRPIRWPEMGETFEPSRQDATLPSEKQ